MVSTFPVPSRDVSYTKLSLMGNNVRESFVSDLTAGDGKIANPFLHCQTVGYALLQGIFAFTNLKKLSLDALQECGNGICIRPVV